MYAANKWEKAQELERAIKTGKTVIVNRYTPSNLAYGMAHGLSLQWLEHLEEDLPKPDLVFILDITAQTSFMRKKKRRDFHENDQNYLDRVRRAYVRLGKKYGWRIISGNREPAIVSVDLWLQASSFLCMESTNE